MKTTRLVTQLMHFFALMLPICLMSSCRVQERIPIDPTDSEQVTFTITVPGSSAAQTRAIEQGGVADNLVASIDLLLFDQQSKMYVGKVLSDQIVDLSAMQKKFTVTIPKGRYDIMILANARSAVNAAIIPANSPLAKNKAEIHNLLVKTLADKTADPMSGGWNAQTGSLGYEPFPMWSEKSDFDVPASGVNLSATLVRMLAKVNLSFSSKEVSDKLIIESIMLCNFNKSGYIASDKWDLTTPDGVSQSQNNIDEKASRSLGVANGIIYSNTAEYPGVIKEESQIQICKDEIFLFESQKPADNNSQQQRVESTCIIIKGKYNGSEHESYYRIDMANRVDQTISYMNVLRNHVYSVIINSVNTAGHPSAEIAYESFPADLNVGISSWNDGGVGETAFDGQYILSVTPAELELFRDLSNGNSFVIHTDYPVAPTIKVVEYTDAGNANWLTNISSVVRKPLLDKEGGVKKAYQVTFDCAENKTGLSRLAKINVTAGNHLNIKVSVTQTAIPPLVLRIDDITGEPQKDISELIFPSGLWPSDPVTPKSIHISWAPYSNNNPCRSISIPSGTDFNFGAGTALPSGVVSLTSDSGTIEYDGIRPPSFTSDEVVAPHEFLEKTRIYNYTTSNGIKTVTKSVMIHQVHFNAVASVSSYYLMDATEHSFKVRSNSGWKVELKKKDGGNGDLKSVVSKFEVATGGYDISSGQVVKFTLKNDIAAGGLIGQADVHFTITCTDPSHKFDPIEVTINAVSGVVQKLSNSYMVAPGGSPILIPVRRANGILLDVNLSPESNWWLGTQITPTGENAKFGYKLLWTDGKGTTNKVLEPDAVVKKIMTVGSGDTGYIWVAPGSKPGNALVAITRTPGFDGAEGTGDILWSFHIWVTTYHPYDVNGDAHGDGVTAPQKYWMNRNLGSKTNILGTADAYGLFYQFGRKDPYPGAATLTGTGRQAGKPVYDSSGDPVEFGYESRYSAEESIRNPLTLINYWYGTFATNAASLSATSWDNNSKKTIYDPCPKGYRVPRYTATASSDLSRDWGTATPNPSTGDGITTPKWESYGIRWDNKGGYYPAAGYLAPDGVYLDIGSIGYARSSTPNVTFDANASSLRFTSGAMNPNNASIKNSAGSVRCVAE